MNIQQVQAHLRSNLIKYGKTLKKLENCSIDRA